MKIKKTLLYLLVPAIAILLSLMAIRFYNNRQLAKETREIETEIAKEAPPLLYGLNLDSFDIEEGQMKRNSSFGNLLYELQLNNSLIATVIDSMKPVFDFRKVKPGDKYTLFYTLDSLRTLKYIVYENTPTDYLLISLSEPVTVASKQKPTRTVEREVTGVIHSSLWNTLDEEKVSPLLAIAMSDIYAWSVDFFALQPRDSFRIIYDEVYVDSQLIELGEVKAACFYHRGESYYAIPFVQDDRLSYFDQDGNSLRKEFLKAPLHFSRISSRFTNRRMHPILRIVRPHHGVDYAAPYGTPVLAIGDGRVIAAGYDGGSGRMIKIRHNSLYTTAYLHLMQFAKGIHQGSEVKQGQVIGYVGSSGMSTGPHLDFRLYKNGSAIDPLKFSAPPVEPIQDSGRARFDSVRNVCLERLSEMR